MSESMFHPGQTVRHRKGGLYRIMHTPSDGAMLESDWKPAYVYRSLTADDPKIVTRAADEMEDGRFSALEPAEMGTNDSNGSVYYYELTVYGFTDDVDLLNSNPDADQLVREAYVGSCVGDTQGLKFSPVPAETLNDELVAIGCDSTFFQSSF